MKRPYLIYLIIVLQCAIFVGVAAVFLGIEGERDQQRESASQLASELIAFRDQLSDANADIMSELAAISQKSASTEVAETCEPTSAVWTVYEDRRIPGLRCTIDRLEQEVQQYTCDSGRQYNKVVSDWKFVDSRLC